MNDVSKNIRAYVFTQVDGNITFNAANVPLYTKAPPNATYPYVIVKSTGLADEPTKDKFGGIYEIQLEIITRFNINLGGQDDADDISNSILNLLRLRTQSSDFGSDTMYILKQTNQRYIEDDDQEFHYYTKILTFEAYVSEN